MKEEEKVSQTISFEKPNYNVAEYVENNFYGKFEIEPLERGFGNTIGNALRRVLLSSLPGTAITSVKIEGVQHEFQTLDGIYEDVTTIILNLKSVVLKNNSLEDKVIRIDVTCDEGERKVLASDIIHDGDLEIVNPDLEIATVTKGGHLYMEMTVSNGRGYVRSEENKRLLNTNKIGVIAIDSLYSPIERVSYEVLNARVGQNENYDKLVLNIWTNGAIKPDEALGDAAKILKKHFEVLERSAKDTVTMIEKTEDSKTKALETSIDDLDFSVRAYNCLKRANIHTLQDLVNKDESEIMKIRNLGKKSLKEVLDKIKEMGLDLKEND